MDPRLTSMRVGAMADAMRREAASARLGQIVYSPEAQLGRILAAVPARLIRGRANRDPQLPQCPV